jgi:hypothetical protein
LVPPNHTTEEGTGLFFILWRRRVEWGVMPLVPLFIMYSPSKKQRKHKYSKYTGAKAQNKQISCKKWSFSLRLFANPLPLTILNNVSMKVVAIGGPLSLTI